MGNNAKRKSRTVVAVRGVLALACNERVVNLRRNVIATFLGHFLSITGSTESHRSAVTGAGLQHADTQLKTTIRILGRFEFNTGSLLDVHVRLDTHVTHVGTAVTEEDVDRIGLANLELAMHAVKGVELDIARSGQVGTTEVHSKLVIDKHPDVIVTAERELHTVAVGELSMGLEAEHLVVQALDTGIPGRVVVNIGIFAIAKFTVRDRIEVDIRQAGNRFNCRPVAHRSQSCLSLR